MPGLLLAVGRPVATVVSRLWPSLLFQLSTRALSVTTSLSIGVKMSCTNAPELSCVPPENRCTDSVAACVPHDSLAGHPPGNATIEVGADATYADSWLSPVTCRTSKPAVNRLREPNAFDHCAIPPTPVSGTS